MKKHPFYGTEIYRDREAAYIENLLKKYRDQPATTELKAKIWEELQKEKHLGNVRIPFKVVLNKDPSGKFPDCIEVLLDTKV